jgi:hypothetical protein
MAELECNEQAVLADAPIRQTNPRTGAHDPK